MSFVMMAARFRAVRYCVVTALQIFIHNTLGVAGGDC